jgi:hypothetical protein
VLGAGWPKERKGSGREKNERGFFHRIQRRGVRRHDARDAGAQCKRLFSRKLAQLYSAKMPGNIPRPPCPLPCSPTSNAYCTC